MFLRPPPRLLALAMLLGALANAGAAGGETRSVASKLDEYLRSQVDRGFSGAVLVARHGKVLLSQGYGYANAEWKIPNTAQTRFRIASLTKSFTATAIMQLRERGQLDLADCICKYVDPCPQAWNSVTLHHLLSNSSGIPNYFWGTEPDRQEAATREQVLARIRERPLEFPPGTQFSYGNSSWYLLGIVIEKVTGASYEKALDGLIFQPLGMRDTGQDDREQALERRASGYLNVDGKLSNVRYEDVSWVIAAASLYSTVEDLYKFERALSGTSLLSLGARTLMWTSLDVPAATGESHYGYGWWIAPKSASVERFQIKGTGGMAGFTSLLSRYEDDDATIIVLQNSIGRMPIYDQIETLVFAADSSRR